MPGHFIIGGHISKVIDAYLDTHGQLEDTLFAAISMDGVKVDELETLVDDLRCVIAEELKVDNQPIDLDPIDNGECATTVRAHLLRAWLEMANDPGVPICDWFTQGAPAGISANFDILDRSPCR